MALSRKFTCFSLIGLTILNTVVLASGDNNDLTKTDDKDSPYPPFTDKEIATIKQFRDSVSPFLYQSYMRRDQYLIRWIRDSNFNLEAAKEKLIKMIKWRKDNNIDTILQEDFTSFQRTCPYTIEGHDRHNRPLGTVYLGKCDLRKLSLSGDIGKFERFMMYVLETAADTVRQLVKSGKDVRDGIIIVDVNGFNLRQHGCIRCIPALFSVLNLYESYYPDYLHRMFFINLPRAAEPIMDIIVPAFSPKLREVFKPYGFNRAEWENEIRKYIEPDQIPYQFGGNKNLRPRT